MYHRLYSLVCKILLQHVTLLTQHGEDMIYILFVRQLARQSDFRIVNILNIIMCYPSAAVIIIVQIAQLYAQHSRLYLVEPTIHATIIKHILPA